MDENRQNGMISIGDYFKIPESELEFVFCRASGPGGQYVNRTDSAAQLRFDVVHSAGIPEEVRVRLLSQAAGQITSEGILLIEAREFRSQQRNKEAAIERFVKILERAARKPKTRRATKPTKASRERRIQRKKRDSEKKRNRRTPNDMGILLLIILGSLSAFLAAGISPPMVWQ